MLASDADEGKLRFPLYVQPKIDGVRGLTTEGGLTGRSLKRFANVHTTNFFSQGAFAGMDGEFAAESAVHPNLCTITNSALTTIEGEPWLMWHVFDLLTPETVGLTYADRYAHLGYHVERIQLTSPHLGAHLRRMDNRIAHSLSELRGLEAMYLERGYEGIILRDPYGKHKQGRSTAREGGLLRIKQFIDFEFVITGVVEGETNTNEAQINELGNTFRSTHQAGMVGNGMVGALLGRLLANVVVDKKVLFHEGESVKVAAGKLTAVERKLYHEQPSLILGQIGKAKFFPKGIKDKPRFPTFQTFRSKTDL